MTDLSPMFLDMQRRADEARASVDGKIFLGAGFAIEAMGGGNLLWSHALPSGAFLLVGAGSDGMGALIADAGEPYIISLHDESGYLPNLAECTHEVIGAKAVLIAAGVLGALAATPAALAALVAKAQGVR